MNEKVTPIGGVKRFVSEQYLSDYVASTTKAGIVQLNDNINSSSTTEAATANAVKKAYDRYPSVASTTKAGIVQLSDDVNSNSSTVAATSKAVQETFTKATTALTTASEAGDVAKSAKDLIDLAQSYKMTRDDGVALFISDCNTVTKTGFYMGSEVKNAPAATHQWIFLRNVVHGTMYQFQEIIDLHDSSKKWTRHQTDGKWSNWESDGNKVYSFQDLNTVLFGTVYGENMTNAPTVGTGHWYTVEAYGDSNGFWGHQIATDWFTHKQYMRRLANGSWTYWVLQTSVSDNLNGGAFDRSGSMPNQADRLNYNGYFYATRVYGAVWNDYAECRQSKTNTEAGRVVIEKGDDYVIPATERLQGGGMIVSDTYGFSIGEQSIEGEYSLPIAVSGRVLAFTNPSDEGKFEVGGAVCTGPNGTVSPMTREEIINYPERIIGTVSSFPSYEKWGTGDIDINNRIWVKVR